MKRRGPKCVNQLDLVEEVVRLLIAEPGLSANEVVAKVDGRRRDVLRAVRLVEVAIEGDVALIAPRARSVVPHFPEGAREEEVAR